MPHANTSNTQNLFSMIGLVIGCVLFGLGSLIVAHVDGVGAYAMAFWRLSVSAVIFLSLAPNFASRFLVHAVRWFWHSSQAVRWGLIWGCGMRASMP
ncbi:Uncharacterised protein [Moraxella caprae]|uniref:Uncharacterized protein n=1 Tax=Moraxella caprae TaxID=90240 RepID=A0A378QZ27_9GAMM|nr:Uncharacterised protein [Moraxella caprae]